jgi:hypothetical protein
MKPETLKALKLSIRKWEQIVEGTGVDTGSDNCALCVRFTDGDGQVQCEEEGEVCPVAKATGNKMCEGSPYTDWLWALDERDYYRDYYVAPWTGDKPTDDETVMCAVLELEFLKSLLP